MLVSTTHLHLVNTILIELLSELLLAFPLEVFGESHVFGLYFIILKLEHLHLLLHVVPLLADLGDLSTSSIDRTLHPGSLIDEPFSVDSRQVAALTALSDRGTICLDLADLDPQFLFLFS